MIHSITLTILAIFNCHRRDDRAMFYEAVRKAVQEAYALGFQEGVAHRERNGT